MNEATRSALADIAASILLLAAFIALIAVAVAMYLLWKGLRAVRDELPPTLAEVDAYVRQIEVRTRDTAHDVVEPPIRVASAWTGLKVGVKTLLSKEEPETDTAGDPKRPPL